MYVDNYEFKDWMQKLLDKLDEVGKDVKSLQTKDVYKRQAQSSPCHRGQAAAKPQYRPVRAPSSLAQTCWKPSR